MKKINKMLYVIFGLALFLLGFIISVFLILFSDLDIINKIVAVCLSLSMSLVGWWLLRRDSKTVLEAIFWLTSIIFP